MEKNEQVMEFGDIIKEIDNGPTLHYNILRSMYLDFIEYLGTSWDEYIKVKTKKEVIEDFKHFSQYYYLPF